MAEDQADDYQALDLARTLVDVEDPAISPSGQRKKGPLFPRRDWLIATASRPGGASHCRTESPLQRMAALLDHRLIVFRRNLVDLCGREPYCSRTDCEAIAAAWFHSKIFQPCEGSTSLYNLFRRLYEVIWGYLR
jgi:hypothetical protein